MQSTSSLPRYVVDASVAIKWFLGDEDHVGEARALLADFREGRIDLVAPDHIQYEVASAIRVATQRNRITSEQGVTALLDFFVWSVPTVGGQRRVLAAYQASGRFNCAFYDGLYIALAEQAGCSLAHADRRLHNTLQGRFARELWIQDYPPTR